MKFVVKQYPGMEYGANQYTFLTCLTGFDALVLVIGYDKDGMVKNFRSEDVKFL